MATIPSWRDTKKIDEFFIKGRFRSVRVDVLLTANALFAGGTSRRGSPGSRS